MSQMLRNFRKQLHLFLIFPLCVISPVLLAKDVASDQIIKSRLDIVGAQLHGQPPVGINDLAAMEPVCALILRHQKLHNDNPSLGKGIWYVQLQGSSLLDLPENNIAKGVFSFHHYCWGEVVRNRAFQEANAKKRRELAEYAMSGSKYVIDHPEFRPQNWPYLSHVYVTMGTGYLLMKETASAINAFLMALQLNPRERIAYINLADTLAQLGKKSEALVHITEGLKHLPNSKALARRYLELGGKLPHPEPYPDLQKENKAEQIGQEDPASLKEPELSAEKSAEVKTPPPEQKRITGKKDNPFCRFCAE